MAQIKFCSQNLVLFQQDKSHSFNFERNDESNALQITVQSGTGTYTLFIDQATIEKLKQLNILTGLNHTSQSSSYASTNNSSTSTTTTTTTTPLLQQQAADDEECCCMPCTIL